MDGIRILCRGEEFFLGYEVFPWFRHQPGNKLRNAQEVSPEHLHWQDIDVDLSIDIIRHPERFRLQAGQ